MCMLGRRLYQNTRKVALVVSVDTHQMRIALMKPLKSHELTLAMSVDYSMVAKGIFLNVHTSRRMKLSAAMLAVDTI